jgi:hypothetical protein
MNEKPKKNLEVKTRAELSCDERGRIKVRVIKPCRNPRLAFCEVLEGELQGTTIVVDVKRGGLFAPGVEFEAVRPRADSKYQWHYDGPLPRFRGDAHMGAQLRGRVIGQTLRGIRGISVIG